MLKQMFDIIALLNNLAVLMLNRLLTTDIHNYGGADLNKATRSSFLLLIRQVRNPTPR